MTLLVARTMTRPAMLMITLAGIGLVALVLTLLLRAADFAYDAHFYTGFPQELDYGEGIVWQQAALIPGQFMYGDLQRYPFLVFHYPPIYHLIANAVAWVGASWLAAGRLVSMVSLAALAVLAGAFVIEAAHQTTPPPPAGHIGHVVPVAGGVVSGLLCFCVPPLQHWATLARVDMLAAAFEMLGMYLGLCGLRRPALLRASALAFVLAGFTKQTSLLGGIATFAVAVRRQRGPALRAAALAGLVGVVAFATLTITTNGGFARHVILYNVSNQMSLNRFIYVLGWDGPQRTAPGYLLVAWGLAGWLLVRWARGRTRPRSPGSMIALLYGALATLSLIGLGKFGSSSNYLIPWACSAVLLIGIAVTTSLRQAARDGGRPTLFLAIAAVLMVQTNLVPRFDSGRLFDPVMRRDYVALLQMTRSAAKPVLSDDMVLLMEAGKPIPWEPAIITALGAAGLFDEQKAIDLVASHAFAFVVIDRAMFGEQFYSPTMMAALQAYYPVSRRIAGHQVMLPAGT